MNPRNNKAYFMLVLASLFWSCNFIVGKIITVFDIPPLSFTFFRWSLVWRVLFPFTIREIIYKRMYIFKNLLFLTLLAIASVSTFNSVVYYSLNFTQVLNAVLMISIIPVVIIFFSSLFKVEKTNVHQIFGLVVSLLGVWVIITRADINKLTSLNFNTGDLWMLVAVLAWAIYSALLKKRQISLTPYAFIQVIVTIGLIFLFPQFLLEHSLGLKVNFNLPFALSLIFVAIFPSLGSYYFWFSSISIIGPNRAGIFLHLMPIFSAIMAMILFKEKFLIFHFIGSCLIVTGIYLSGKRNR